MRGAWDLRAAFAVSAHSPGPSGIDITSVKARFERCAPAQPDQLAPLRTAVWHHAQALGASEEVAQAVRTAVGEALLNVVMHAYLNMEPGSMMVEAWLDDQHFVVRILDEGRGLVPRTDSPGLGLGLGLMAQLSDDLSIANREDSRGTTVALRFWLRSSGPD